MFRANTLNVLSQNIQPFRAKTYNDSDSKKHKKIRHIRQTWQTAGLFINKIQDFQKLNTDFEPIITSSGTSAHLV